MNVIILDLQIQILYVSKMKINAKRNIKRVIYIIHMYLIKAKMNVNLLNIMTLIILIIVINAYIMMEPVLQPKEIVVNLFMNTIAKIKDLRIIQQKNASL